MAAASFDGRTRELADGNRIPVLGLGVWQVPNGRECVNAMLWALELGYRHIDTAQAYGNEASVGEALRRSGVEGRDKGTKPIFVDLESYLCLEMFHHWLVKAGELEVTEMLPDPEHLCWQEADGRRTFELRTLIVPRS
jgi:hypothetical protein